MPVPPPKWGYRPSRFREIWYGMKFRCKEGQNYYKEGIRVCDRWLTFKNFQQDMEEAYWEHVREYGESETTIDRIDNKGNYEPSNCRWATRDVQNRNRSFKIQDQREEIYRLRKRIEELELTIKKLEEVK